MRPEVTAPDERDVVEAGPLIISASAQMAEILALVGRVAAGDAKVLITGESGVGKDLIARVIHQRSARASRAYVAVNCAGLTETLLESELFGHVKGSFTGAYRDKPGKLQLAHRGTLFLDEVGEMSLRMQALLLRFLENGEIQAVGADHARTTVDVRVVAATNRNLSEMVAAGQFREDLLYRLRVIHVHVPPLRERRRQVADELYQALVSGGYSFWQHIHPLFLARDITRHDMRELVRRGLSTTRGNYRAMLRLFGMAAQDYKRFLNFLAAHECNVDFREFRHGNPAPQRAPRLLPPLPEQPARADRPAGPGPNPF